MPLALSRITAQFWFAAAVVRPATMILPSACRAAATARSVPPKSTAMVPSLSKLGSSAPSAVSRVTTTSEAPVTP